MEVLASLCSGLHCPQQGTLCPSSLLLGAPGRARLGEGLTTEHAHKDLVSSSVSKKASRTYLVPSPRTPSLTGASEAFLPSHLHQPFPSIIWYRELPHFSCMQVFYKSIFKTTLSHSHSLISLSGPSNVGILEPLLTLSTAWPQT